MLAEIPIFYPGGSKRRRYAVKDGRVFRELPTGANDNISTADTDAQSGATSHSPLEGGSDCVVTSALVEDPSVVVILLVHSEGQTSIELNLRDAAIDSPVRVQCFEQGRNQLALVTADAKANILSLKLERETLSPITDSLTTLSVSQLLDESGHPYAGAELHSSMICFLSTTSAIVGLSPYILSLDIAHRRVSVWSEADCLAQMNGGVKSVLTKAATYLVGSVEEPVDMASVSAMTTVHDANTDCYLVFTLHSDCTLRRWKLKDGGALPVEVLLVDIDLPSNWNNETHNSIALRSRLYPSKGYDSPFAVAIHIQTSNASGASNDNSNCHLSVVNGTADSPYFTVLPLTVPKQASHVLDMNLSPGSQRCQLTAIFKAENQGNLVATYPPSYTSILSSQPDLTRSEYTLDGVAATERERFASTTFSIADADDASDLDKSLHKVDTLYMKHLFRPAYPRGSGTVTGPCVHAVRSSLSRLVHGHAYNDDRSVELETLRAMHEWRRLENRSLNNSRNLGVAPTTPAHESASSVYHSYASPGPMHYQEGATDEMEAEMHLDKQSQIEAHEKRWARLVRTVLEEEDSLRAPLLLSTITSSKPGESVLVRGNVVSMLVPFEVSTRDDAGGFLDQTAIAFLDCIEATKETSILLQEIETKTLGLIAEAVSLVEPDQRIVAAMKTELGNLGTWALNSNISIKDSSEAVSVDSIKFRDTLANMSESDIVSWIQEPPFNSSLPGLALLSGESMDMPDGTRTFRNHGASPDMRHSSCTVTVQSMDSARRLALGRCLLLFGFTEVSSLPTTELLRSYLQSLAVMWGCGQRVEMPAISSRASMLHLGDSPPNKRLSFGDGDDASILQGSQKTTVLDALIIRLSQTMDGPSNTMACIALANEVISSSYGMNQDFTNTPYSMLQRDIGSLPAPSSDAIVSDHPRVALRLFLPSSFLPHPEEDAATAFARQEAVAECLLIEANANPVKSAAEWMRGKACSMLVAGHESFDLSTLEKSAKFLKSWGENYPQTPSVDTSDAEQAMEIGLHHLLHGSSATVLNEVGRLCRLATTRELFLPLFTGGVDRLERLDAADTAAVTTLANALVRLANLMNRLDILERHTDRLGRLASSGGSDSLLNHVENTITEVETFLPKSLFTSMQEYASLWSRLYRYAESAGMWSIAYNACISNPLLEARVNNFQRLVNSMVKAGSMDCLLDMCSSLAASGQDAIDLYEIASESFGTNKRGDRYGLISEMPPDYLGCLYSLHAVKEDWKRAAQAMDLRYIDALSAIDLPAQDSGVDEKLAVKDAVLSALGAAASMSLVPESDKRFLISGEFGVHPALPLVEEGPKSILKRGRDQDILHQPKDVASRSHSDRLSRFMTNAELNRRAVNAIGFRTLFLDDFASRYESSILHGNPSAEVERDFINSLGASGYFHEGFLSAITMSQSHEARTGATKSGGRDLLHDALSHLLCKYVAPATMQNANTQDGDVDMEGRPQPRCTLSQIHRATDALSGVPATSSFTRGQKTAAAMELLRKVITHRSNASSPIAIEVAGHFMDLATCRSRLPEWLESLLMGVGAPGLFASTPGADPAALVGLYTKRGLYKEACDVVASVLLGGVDGQNRESRAPCRLPEKGDIDFVPYNRIDILWELTEHAISGGKLDLEEAQELQASRTKMELALEKHFELMKISELGLQSARTLS